MISGGSGRCWSLRTAAGTAVCTALLAVPVFAQAPATSPPAAQPPGQLSPQPPSQPPNQPQGAAAGSPPAAEPASPNPPSPGEAGAEPFNPSFKPGFIDAFGRWLEDGASKFKSDMQGAQDKFDKLNNEARAAAKDAIKDGPMGLPGARAQSGRERCAPADNGASDCQAAAIALCRGKGFQTGKSLDTQSEQKCPAKVFLEGRTPNNTECPTTIFVTRAMCQ